ncbi:hypothetical protein FACS1894170_00090 [Planctomycetales bacterium]|nr:hypothetical protein FACS1894170_00090 [Planctomycetales bacterium]
MGDRYALAIMTYLGIALLMVGTTLHGDTNVYAQSGGTNIAEMVNETKCVNLQCKIY